MGKKHFASLEVEPRSELAERFEYIRKKLGFPTRTSLLIHLINDAYDRYQRGNEQDVE